MQQEDNQPSHSKLRCPLCRPWFGVALVGFWACAGLVYFFATHLLEKYHPKDFWFYVIIYSGIGASTGALSWYLARLVAFHRMKLRHVVTIIVLPYLFILLVSIDKNPSVAILASVAFVFVVCLAFLAHAVAQHEKSGGQLHEA